MIFHDLAIIGPTYLWFDVPMKNPFAVLKFLIILVKSFIIWK